MFSQDSFAGKTVLGEILMVNGENHCIFIGNRIFYHNACSRSKDWFLSWRLFILYQALPVKSNSFRCFFYLFI